MGKITDVGLDDIGDESDIPDLPDEVLCDLVAAWAPNTAIKCMKCGGTGYDRRGGAPISASADGSDVPVEPEDHRCGECDGRGFRAPDYTSDDSAAWRLLEVMPTWVAQPKGAVDKSACEGRLTTGRGRWHGRPDGSLKRALAEAAATLAVNGVEPKQENE